MNTIYLYIILKPFPFASNRTSSFEYHISLHHSQTRADMLLSVLLFEYHISLHHSQTELMPITLGTEFEYHISLHHSQTLRCCI